MSELPEYVAAWNLVLDHEITDADRAALLAGTVRGTYLAAVVTDVVQQAGSIAGVPGRIPAHPVLLSVDPQYGYVLESIGAVDHGVYEEYRDAYTSLWEAAVRYVRLAWPVEIRGFAVTWEE